MNRNKFFGLLWIVFIGLSGIIYLLQKNMPIRDPITRTYPTMPDKKALLLLGSVSNADRWLYSDTRKELYNDNTNTVVNLYDTFVSKDNLEYSAHAQKKFIAYWLLTIASSNTDEEMGLVLGKNITDCSGNTYISFANSWQDFQKVSSAGQPYVPFRFKRIQDDQLLYSTELAAREINPNFDTLTLYYKRIPDKEMAPNLKQIENDFCARSDNNLATFKFLPFRSIYKTTASPSQILGNLAQNESALRENKDELVLEGQDVMPEEHEPTDLENSLETQNTDAETSKNKHAQDTNEESSPEEHILHQDGQLLEQNSRVLQRVVDSIDSANARFYLVKAYRQPNSECVQLTLSLNIQGVDYLIKINTLPAGGSYQIAQISEPNNDRSPVYQAESYNFDRSIVSESSLEKVLKSIIAN